MKTLNTELEWQFLRKANQTKQQQQKTITRDLGIQDNVTSRGHNNTGLTNSC